MSSFYSCEWSQSQKTVTPQLGCQPTPKKVERERNPKFGHQSLHQSKKGGFQTEISDFHLCTDPDSSCPLSQIFLLRLQAFRDTE